MSDFRPYDQRPLMQFLQLLMRTFQVGTWFGVEVRMFWTAAILTPLLLTVWTAPAAGTFAEGLTLVAIQFGLLFGIIWSHEMFHIAAGWRYGIPTNLITLSPLGGLAHLGHAAPTPTAEIRIALAGPAVHLLWLAVFAPLYWLLPGRMLVIAGWTFCPIGFTLWFLVTTNLALMLFNLLPFFPLDGGRAARGLLALKWHPNRVTLWATTAGMIGGGLMMFVAFTRARIESTILFVIGLSVIFACLNERRMARHSLIYQGVQRHPWETDPDAWKRGAAVAEPRPGPLGRWRQRRAAQKKMRSAQAERDLDRDVDAVLERLHDVGMTGLTKDEKSILKRASRRRRGAG